MYRHIYLQIDIIFSVAKHIFGNQITGSTHRSQDSTGLGERVQKRPRRLEIFGGVSDESKFREENKKKESE